MSIPHTRPTQAVMDDMVHVTHTHTTGSCIHHTHRGDGCAPILRDLGWRWSPTLATWCLPRSRHRDADRQLLEGAVTALAAAGIEATLSIDESTPSVAEREEELARRGMARAARLQARADKAAAAAADLDARGGQLRERMPFAQPVLAGTAGAAATSKHYAQVVDLADAATRARAQAKDLAAAAAAATANVAGRQATSTVTNRIRRLERELAGSEGLDRNRLQCELDYWRSVRSAQVADGKVLDLGPGQVQVGDRVQIGQHWYTVAKVNKKTVAVEGQHGKASRVPYTAINGLERSGEPGIHLARRA